MRVKSCQASDGQKHVIKLSNDMGCVLRPKMISNFYKIHGTDDRSSVLVYAFFHAFKFPDSLSVHIKCNVEICRHGCLSHCPQNENGSPGPQHPILTKNIFFPQAIPDHEQSINPALEFYKKIDDRKDTLIDHNLVYFFNK